MGQIVAWNDIKFSLGGNNINAVEDIEISGSCETEDKETDGEKYVNRKSAKPYEISMKAILDARLGVDVKKMATKMTEAARKSKSGYFYTGSAKLFPCKFMLIEASIGEIVMNPKGTWISCEVSLKLKQSTKYDGTTQSTSSGGGGSSSSSSSKKSSTKRSTTTTTTNTASSSDVDVVSSAAPSMSGSKPTSYSIAKAAVNASPTASKIVSTVNQFTSIVKSSSAFQSSSSSSSSSKAILPALK